MRVKRIAANVSASAPSKAKRFYQDLLGLDVLMDMGWPQSGQDHAGSRMVRASSARRTTE
jgi:hypothetical protein